MIYRFFNSSFLSVPLICQWLHHVGYTSFHLKTQAILGWETSLKLLLLLELVQILMLCQPRPPLVAVKTSCLSQVKTLKIMLHLHATTGSYFSRHPCFNFAFELRSTSVVLRSGTLNIAKVHSIPH